MVPIAKLPVEIIVWIFRELRDIHVDSHSHGWIVVTHVCRTWRLAALDTAELWTQIYSLDPDCVQAFLTRSKRAPLDVCYPQAWPGGHELDSILPMLLPESSRFRRVESAHPSVAHTFLVYPFHGGAPILSHLSLDYSHISRISTHESTPETMTLLANIMPEICAHGLPSLRRLRLEHWPVQSLSSLRNLFNPSLRSLVITVPRKVHSASTWADILTGLPLLEKLVLTSHGFPPPSSRQEQLPLVHLPHLSYLKLVSYNPIDQLSLLRCIVPSSDAQIDYATYAHPWSLVCSEISFKHYTDILHTVSQKFVQERRTPVYLTSLHLKFVTMPGYAHPGLSVTLSTAADDTSDRYCLRSPSNSDIPPILVLSCQPLDIRRHDFYTPLSGMLHTTFEWSKLRGLCLAESHTSITPVQDALAFKSLFTQMKNLHSLSIPSTYLDDCLSSLLGAFDTFVEPDAEERASAAKRVLFPALEILTVHGRPDRENGGYESLRRALLSRKEGGFPVPRVHICLSGWRIPTSVDAAEVGPLTTMGCAVNVCIGQDISWSIEEFASTD